MDKVFFSYSENYEKSADSQILNSIVSYDTSCLLNLYRCTEKSRVEMLDLIKRIDEKFGHFVTHHVALEFSVNKNEAKKDVDSRFSAIQSSFSSFKKELKGSLKLDGLKTPLDEMNKDLAPMLDDIHNTLVSNKKKIAIERGHDSVFDSIGSIFSNKVTSGFDVDRLNEISKEGECRFLCKIPPGFEDGSKTDYINVGGFGVERKYSDLIVWFQLIEHSIEIKKDLIFITADEKPD